MLSSRGASFSSSFSHDHPHPSDESPCPSSTVEVDHLFRHLSRPDRADLWKDFMFIILQPKLWNEVQAYLPAANGAVYWDPFVRSYLTARHVRTMQGQPKEEAKRGKRAAMTIDEWKVAIHECVQAWMASYSSSASSLETSFGVPFVLHPPFSPATRSLVIVYNKDEPLVELDDETEEEAACETSPSSSSSSFVCDVSLPRSSEGPLGPPDSHEAGGSGACHRQRTWSTLLWSVWVAAVHDALSQACRTPPPRHHTTTKASPHHLERTAIDAPREVDTVSVVPTFSFLPCVTPHAPEEEEEEEEESAVPLSRGLSGRGGDTTPPLFPQGRRTKARHMSKKVLPMVEYGELLECLVTAASLPTLLSRSPWYRPGGVEESEGEEATAVEEESGGSAWHKGDAPHPEAFPTMASTSSASGRHVDDRRPFPLSRPSVGTLLFVEDHPPPFPEGVESARGEKKHLYSSTPWVAHHGETSETEDGEEEGWRRVPRQNPSILASRFHSTASSLDDPKRSGPPAGGPSASSTSRYTPTAILASLASFPCFSGVLSASVATSHGTPAPEPSPSSFSDAMHSSVVVAWPQKTFQKQPLCSSVVPRSTAAFPTHSASDISSLVSSLGTPSALSPSCVEEPHRRSSRLFSRHSSGGGGETGGVERAAKRPGGNPERAQKKAAPRGGKSSLTPHKRGRTAAAEVMETEHQPLEEMMRRMRQKDGEDDEDDIFSSFASPHTSHWNRQQHSFMPEVLAAQLCLEGNEEELFEEDENDYGRRGRRRITE